MKTQVLDYNVWPLLRELQNPPSTEVKDADISKAPIASVLLDLRKALVLSAMQHDYSTNPPTLRKSQPCFTDFDPTKPASDAGHQFKIGLQIVQDPTAGISVGARKLEPPKGGEKVNDCAKSQFSNALATDPNNVGRGEFLQQLNRLQFE